MLIGRGLVARNFKRYEVLDDFLVFASGVSNSKSCTAEDFRRERGLLMASIDANPLKKLIYFSTTSINDPDLLDTPYVLHKLAMEDLVRQSAQNWQIFRLSNLAGFSDNMTTILNFFYFSVVQEKSFQLWKFSERNIIDASDVYHICDHILRHNFFPDQIVNIANPANYAVAYIVRSIEAFTGKKAVYTEKEKGSAFRIDVSDMLPLCKDLQIGFGADYLPCLLKKYYSKK